LNNIKELIEKMTNYYVPEKPIFARN